MCEEFGWNRPAQACSTALALAVVSLVALGRLGGSDLSVMRRKASSPREKDDAHKHAGRSIRFDRDRLDPCPHHRHPQLNSNATMPCTTQVSWRADGSSCMCCRDAGGRAVGRDDDGARGGIIPPAALAAAVCFRDGGQRPGPPPCPAALEGVAGALGVAAAVGSGVGGGWGAGARWGGVAPRWSWRGRQAGAATQQQAANRARSQRGAMVGRLTDDREHGCGRPLLWLAGSIDDDDRPTSATGPRPHAEHTHPRQPIP